jgi:Na+-transporting methylmalonyl-CoA/oxaloacetate decarboxylase gamma subunit
VLRFLLFILLVILVARFISRLVFSSYSYSGRSNSTADSPKSEKEGKVTVEKNQKSDKKYSKDDGEYVDYEEIK